MSKLQNWSYIILAVVVAIAANSISAVWASRENKFSTIWFLLLLLISPIVFITFGVVTSRIGLSVSSATIDSLLTVGTILVGLFLFHEWDKISLYQYMGIILTISGIILMQINKVK